MYLEGLLIIRRKSFTLQFFMKTMLLVYKYTYYMYIKKKQVNLLFSKRLEHTHLVAQNAKRIRSNCQVIQLFYIYLRILVQN